MTWLSVIVVLDCPGFSASSSADTRHEHWIVETGLQRARERVAPQSYLVFCSFFWEPHYSASQHYTSMEQFPWVTAEEKLYWQSTVYTSILAQWIEGNSGLVLGQSNHHSCTLSLTLGLFSCRITGEWWRKWCCTCLES